MMQAWTEDAENKRNGNTHTGNLIGNDEELKIHKGRYNQGTTKSQITGKKTWRLLPVLNKEIQMHKEITRQ
jgi:hypothetical protein